MLTTGPSCDIIQLALSLGILCRPVNSPRVGVGEALEVSKDLFWRATGDGHSRPFQPTPEELTHEWELVTHDLIRSEYHRESEQPW